MSWDSHGALGFPKKERTRQTFKEQVAFEPAFRPVGWGILEKSRGNDWRSPEVGFRRSRAAGPHFWNAGGMCAGGKRERRLKPKMPSD